MIDLSRKRLVRVLTVLVIILGLTGGGLAGYLTYSVYFNPLPKTSGINQVDGLHDTVSVYRDSWAIPQIYAVSSADLFFTQGYVQAQERWWQMELGRYLAMGRLNEILTPDELVLQADRLMLALGWAEAAEEAWGRASPASRAALESYSAGVNAYIQDRDAEELASEYGLLGLSGQYDHLLAYLGRDMEVEPWEPAHSFMLAYVFAWGMNGDLWAELDRLIWHQQLPLELVAAYDIGFPYGDRATVLSVAELGLTASKDAPLTYVPVLPPEIELDVEELESRLLASRELMAMLGFQPTAGGNAWVLSGDHTASGKPLLANDIQMPVEIPSPWFEMGLHCAVLDASCPYAVVGFTLPGIPGVVVGHNEQIAWGISPARTDVLDLYVLRLNADNPQHYEVDGQWLDLEQQTKLIGTPEEDAEQIELVTYRSVYGPVVTDIDGPPHARQALALHWTAFEQTGDLVGSVLELNRAQDWTAFRQALRAWKWPAAGFVYADVDGNIGYQVAGALPIRFKDHSGMAPAPGWDSRYAWREMVPFDLLPHVANPPDGMIVDANNAVVPPAYYAWLDQQQHIDREVNTIIGGSWTMGYRSARIETMLTAIRQHTVDSFALIQADNHNTFAEELLPYLFALEFEDVELQAALDWLKEWDLQNHMDSPQAVLFSMLWSELARMTFGEHLLYDGLEREMWAVVQLVKQPEHLWWDDDITPFARETRDDVLRDAFVSANRLLINEVGTDRTEWRWGDLHQAKFVSRIIGHDGFISNPAINSGPFPLNRGVFDISGGVGAVNATTYDLEEPFSVKTLPAYRVIIDLDDFNNSRAMLATGQSGHPASDNYKDMIVPWRTVEYHDLHWATSTIRDLAAKRLDLRPQQ